MATAFGWTWEYIDECVTVPRLLEIGEYWTVTPPLAEAFAAFVGAMGGPSSTSPAIAEPSADNNPGLLGELAGFGITIPRELLTP